MDIIDHVARAMFYEEMARIKTVGRWEDHSSYHNPFRGMARAAIKAMREAGTEQINLMTAGADPLPIRAFGKQESAKASGLPMGVEVHEVDNAASDKIFLLPREALSWPAEKIAKAVSDGTIVSGRFSDEKDPPTPKG